VSERDRDLRAVVVVVEREKNQQCTMFFEVREKIEDNIRKQEPVSKAL